MYKIIKTYRNSFAAMLGQMLKFYDFPLPAVSYNTLSKELFPVTDSKFWLNVRGILLVSIGYLSKPVGGWFFGIIGNRDSRTRSLRLLLSI